MREQPQIVGDYLAEECAQGRILGPLDPKSFPQVHTSRIGIIPKSTPGKWCLIVDLSSPRGGGGGGGGGGERQRWYFRESKFTFLRWGGGGHEGHFSIWEGVSVGNGRHPECIPEYPYSSR